jgi:hypothetical protein
MRPPGLLDRQARQLLRDVVKAPPMLERTDETWLSLEEAAARVGVSRMRMREAIAAGLCKGRRDNRGLWRVALGENLAALKSRIETARVAPGALVELLFDEIEENSLMLAERDATLDRMSALVERQQEILARALSLAEARAPAELDRIAAVNERATALIETAFQKLSSRDNEVFNLTGLLDRAFAMISKLEDEVKRQAGVEARQKGLLDRLLAIANARLEQFSATGARGGGLLTRLRGRVTGRRGGGTPAGRA